MKKYNLDIKSNEYFTESTTSILMIALTKNREVIKDILDVSYGAVLAGYPNDRWRNINTDLFQYFSDDFLDALRNDKTILVVDYAFEGFSYIECPIIEILERNCKLYNINPNRVFYFSGNLKDTSDTINAIPIYVLDNKKNFRNYIFDFKNRNSTYLKEMCEKNLSDKVFLSLSRRNRFHRVLAHAMLVNSELKDYGLISQDKLEKNIYVPADVLERAGLTEKTWKQFAKQLPMIADADNFDDNQPFNPLEELHTSTVFSIVNETLADGQDDTSLFFSEKILKPIVNFQPMIIYGQPGINHSLKELGFRTYEDYFDLSFDWEQDDILRYKKLMASISDLVKKLNAMSKEEKIAWRFKHEELLQHNYQVFMDEVHSTQVSKLVADKVFKVFDNN